MLGTAMRRDRSGHTLRPPDASAAAEVVCLVQLPHRCLLRPAQPDAVLSHRAVRVERDRQLLGRLRGVLRLHGDGHVLVPARAQAPGSRRSARGIGPMTSIDTRPPPTSSRTPRRMPGIEGFWVFIAGDMAIFTLMFLAFAVTRRDDVPGFEAARATLDIDRGGINTLVLLTSSACVASALKWLRAGEQHIAARWTAWGIVGGLVFIALKSTEYVTGFRDGHTPAASEFYVYYLAITGIHLIHVIAGCIVLGTFWVRMRRSPMPGVTGFETAACYWHLVDLLWLLIFPLIYLIR
ncbi:hypothetical protein GII31_14875 [Gordonia pseudamarae]|uniref:Cytochrome aa3 subunit 3 n=2 Tax=Gordoniaceae TaxID=85026 RepID=A0ABX6IKX9_9ACTN|nr:hypothetical protein GII31_14875 [Gordonia pseudamarae]